MTENAYFALGCFWGAEKLFWQTPGVIATRVGYAGGDKPNPNYQEVCTGRTGHAETVEITYDPARISYLDLLKIFFENHDPTQGNRQGNDIGSQYRSVIFTTGDQQASAAQRLLDTYQPALSAAGYGSITTTVEPLQQFWPAEAYHQRYLEKNPGGYCPIHATGVVCR